MENAPKKMSKKQLNVNPVCWFEIYVDELDRAAKFYETVLSTKLEKLPSPKEEVELVAFPMEMAATGAAGALCRMEGVCIAWSHAFTSWLCVFVRAISLQTRRVTDSLYFVRNALLCTSE